MPPDNPRKSGDTIPDYTKRGRADAVRRTMERGAGRRNDDSAAAVSVLLLRARFFGSLCKANAADGDPAYSADSAAAAFSLPFKNSVLSAAMLPALRRL